MDVPLKFDQSTPLFSREIAELHMQIKYIKTIASVKGKKVEGRDSFRIVIQVAYPGPAHVVFCRNTPE